MDGHKYHHCENGHVVAYLNTALNIVNMGVYLNKLGLSCAKLRASLGLLVFDNFLVIL